MYMKIVIRLYFKIVNFQIYRNSDLSKSKFNFNKLNFSNLKMNTNCDINIINTRTYDDLTSEQKNAIATITSQTNIFPVGTYQYKIFKFPNDIDLYEEIVKRSLLSEAKLEVAQDIQNIILKINSNPRILFSDFKAGYDNRFKIYTGYDTEETIEDYNYELICRDLQNLYCANLLTKCQYCHLYSYVKENPTYDDIIALRQELRNFWVLRWSTDEILRGYKLLPGNYKLFLDHAIAQNTMVKMDILVPITDINDPRYIEVTNFFNIVHQNNLGQYEILTEKLKEYVPSLIEDFYHYYPINIYKAIKRLWMVLKVNNDICGLNMLSTIFDSDIALYSQIAGDIEVVIDLLNSNLNYDKQFLVDSIYRRLLRLNGICLNGNLNKNNLTNVEYLNDIYKCIKNYVNIETNNWLQINRIDLFSLIPPKYRLILKK